MALLKGRNISYEAIFIDEHLRERDAMIAASNGATSTPQVFIEGRHIGGADELAALDQSGGLDHLANEEVNQHTVRP
jgi:glutaredoxin 3